jgi:hypothetical protein
MIHYRLCHNEIDALEDGLFFTLTCKSRLRAKLLFFALCVLSVNTRSATKNENNENKKGE